MATLWTVLKGKEVLSRFYSIQKSPDVAYWRSTFQNVDWLTRNLILLSIVCGLQLAVPRIAEFCSIVPDPSAWMGIVSDTYSFTILIGVFMLSEAEACAACAVSAFGNFILLVQMYTKGAVPGVTVSLVALLFISTCGLHLLEWTSIRMRLAGMRKLAHRSWKMWQSVLAILGLGMCFQYAFTFLLELELGLWPAVFGVAIGYRFYNTLSNPKTPSWWHTLWADMPAWMATALLCIQSCSSLMGSLQNPSLLVGPASSPWTTLLLCGANGFMVPRALRIRDVMMFTGTFTCAAMEMVHSMCWLTAQLDCSWVPAAGKLGLLIMLHAWLSGLAFIVHNPLSPTTQTQTKTADSAQATSSHQPSPKSMTASKVAYPDGVKGGDPQERDSPSFAAQPVIAGSRNGASSR